MMRKWEGKILSSFCTFYLFLLISWGGVWLSPFSTSATTWPIIPAPDDRCWWVWSSRWNDNWQGKPKYSEKTCPSATLFPVNPTLIDLRSYPGRRNGKPAAKCLSCCMASSGGKSELGLHQYSATYVPRTFMRNCLFAR
jgi:hypothetical protein